MRALLSTLLLLVAGSQQACLSNITLTGLGFKNMGNWTYNNNSAVCTNIFNQYGSCVQTDEIRDFLNDANKNFKNRIDDGSSFTGIYDSVKNSVGSIFTSNNGTNTTFLDNMRDRSDAARNSCLQAYATINTGLYCLLASQVASTYATDLGTNVQTTVNTAAVGSKLEACLPLIDSICLFSYGVSISTDITLNLNNTLGLNITNATCLSLRNVYNCTTDNSTCLDTRRQILINNIFRGNDIQFVPSKSTLDKIKDVFSNIGSTIKGWFSRRLQTTGTKVATTQADPSGRDVYNDGQNSNIAAPTTSSAAILASAAFLLLSLFA